MFNNILIMFYTTKSENNRLKKNELKMIVNYYNYIYI